MKGLGLPTLVPGCKTMIFNLFKKSQSTAQNTVEVNAYNLFNTQKNAVKVSSLAEVENPLALRVVNKIASYVMGSGYRVEFDSAEIDEWYEAWALHHQVKHTILEGIRQSLAMPKGCLVYLVGGLIDKPITKLEGINLVDTAQVELSLPDNTQIFNPGYGKTIVTARTTGGNKVIDPTRYGIIDLTSNTSTYRTHTSSFVERILPASEIMMNLINKAENILDRESAIIYKSTTHNKEIPKEKVTGYVERMSLIREHMKNGSVALIPALDDIMNFSGSTSIDKLLPAMKDVYSAITGVPKSILFGEMQSGINTGAGKERDQENFMRDMRGYQESAIRPLIEKIVQVFAVENRIDNPPYRISFKEPEPMSERERVELDKLHNDGVIALTTAGLLDEEEARANIRGVMV